MIKKLATIAFFSFLSIHVVVAKSSCSVSENPYVRKNLNLVPAKSSCSAPKYPAIPKSFRLSYAHSGRSRPANVKEQNPYIHKQISLPSSFNAVTVIGDIDVDMDGSRGQQVKVSGRLKDVQSVVTYVRGKTLYVTTLTKGKRTERLKMRINTLNLSQFRYDKGFGRINMQGLSSRYPIFCMNIQGAPKVNINGDLRLQKLIVGGQSQVSIYWVNSCDFSLVARDNASVCVGGIATTFEAFTCQCARINAKYLRTKRVFAKSYGCSRMDVRASCALNALASDGSAIYFYQNPRFQAPFMQRAGSVIQMTDLCCPPCGICDNACCKNGWH